MKKWISIIFIVTGLLAILTYKMFGLAQVECSLCVNFDGRELCTKAHGVDEQAAIEEAHRNACSQLTSGVTNTLACSRVPGTHETCQRSLANRD